MILDLHAAPDGQGKDANISDHDPAKPSLSESEEYRRKTVALWRRPAQRYPNEPRMADDDSFNEPNWTFEGEHKNGRKDESNQPTVDLYRAVTRASREVDTAHLIIVEGNGSGNNDNGFPDPRGREPRDAFPQVLEAQHREGDPALSRPAREVPPARLARGDLRATVGHRCDLMIAEQEAVEQEIVANAEACRKRPPSAGHVRVYRIPSAPTRG